MPPLSPITGIFSNTSCLLIVPAMGHERRIVSSRSFCYIQRVLLCLHKSGSDQILTNRYWQRDIPVFEVVN